MRLRPSRLATRAELHGSWPARTCACTRQLYAAAAAAISATFRLCCSTAIAIAQQRLQAASVPALQRPATAAASCAQSSSCCGAEQPQCASQHGPALSTSVSCATACGCLRRSPKPKLRWRVGVCDDRPSCVMACGGLRGSPKRCARSRLQHAVSVSAWLSQPQPQRLSQHQCQHLTQHRSPSVGLSIQATHMRRAASWPSRPCACRRTSWRGSLASRPPSAAWRSTAWQWRCGGPPSFAGLPTSSWCRTTPRPPCLQ